MTLTFDRWLWPFAWTSLLSMVITLENFMIWWWEHSVKAVTDWRPAGLNHPQSCLVTAKNIDPSNLLITMAFLIIPIPQISAFSPQGSVQTGTQSNLHFLIWKKIRRKCRWEYSDRNAEKSPHFYKEKNAEEMRRKCGWEYSDRNTEKSPHYIPISAITRRIFPHSQFSASQP